MFANTHWHPQRCPVPPKEPEPLMCMDPAYEQETGNAAELMSIDPSMNPACEPTPLLEAASPGRPTLLLSP